MCLSLQQGGARRYAQRTAVARDHARYVVADFVDLTENDIGGIQHSLARTGQHHAFLHALKKLDPEFVLDFAQLVAECRLRDEEPLPGCGQGSFDSHGLDESQVAKLHGLAISPCHGWFETDPLADVRHICSRTQSPQQSIRKTAPKVPIELPDLVIRPPSPACFQLEVRKQAVLS